MLRIRPFEAIHPRANHAASVSSVPYDVVSRDEARALAEGLPQSFLHVIRPDIDLPDGTDPYDDAVYDRARANFEGMLADEVLVRDDRPRLYLYRQVMDGVAQVGVVCCCHVDDYANDVIRKHEHTRPDKEDDRTRHVQTLNANAGPVFLTYRDDDAIDAIVQEAMNARPFVHFIAPDDVTHTVWKLDDTAPLVDAFGRLDAGYVADGHHRSASAARAADERRRVNSHHTGDEEYNWFLCVLFPASQLTILAYNRVISDLGAHTPASFLEALGAVGTLTSTDQPVPECPGVFCFYLEGAWHRLALDPATIPGTDVIGTLDVSLLQERVLAPLLDIHNQSKDQRIGFVGGIRGTDELARRVDEGKAALAISMHPTTIEQLLAVSDAGAIMPTKSTWFEPKLRSGLFVHSLD